MGLAPRFAWIAPVAQPLTTDFRFQDHHPQPASSVQLASFTLMGAILLNAHSAIRAHPLSKHQRSYASRVPQGAPNAPPHQVAKNVQTPTTLFNQMGPARQTALQDRWGYRGLPKLARLVQSTVERALKELGVLPAMQGSGGRTGHVRRVGLGVRIASTPGVRLVKQGWVWIVRRNVELVRRTAWSARSTPQFSA